MKILFEVPTLLAFAGWTITGAWAGESPPSGAMAAVQAIQQASDPSAVVAAYANGVAADRNDSRLEKAYVSRMLDLGLPELAYHQAQTLTTLDSNDGLAWGVVAYVNARKGDMPEAISAINLAGQYLPKNAFVQRTVGEILAWYDSKADKSTVSENAKDGLAKIRTLLQKEPDFTAAYDTAKSAYQSKMTQSSGVGYAVPPLYSADCYSGPDWWAPAPWWWWQPCGFFAGFDFFPFSTVIVFEHHHFFHHHHFFEHDGFFHDHDFFHHGGLNSSLALSANGSFATGRTFSPGFVPHTMASGMGSHAIAMGRGMSRGMVSGGGFRSDGSGHRSGGHR